MYIIEVTHMAQLKQHMYQHLRSAKEWLTKAEDAFAKEHNVRAELDLMLAQAELKHATEVNRSRQWRYKYVILRHGLALTFAMSMVIAIGGVYWWTTRPVALPLPAAVQVNLPAEVKISVETVDAPSSITPITQTESNIPVGKIVKEETVRPEPVMQTSQPKPPRYQAPAVVSEDEVQKLVRAAGKTLRGQ